MPFVPEADPDQQETPQRIYFHSHNRKGNRIKGKIPLPCPNTERQGIGQSEVWTTPLKESGEGLFDLFYETTPNPHDRTEGGIKEFSFGHQKSSGIGIRCPALPLYL
jgi:hypothetical protein